MFASYEVATSFPSLTAIKGYHLDKSSDVPFNGTLCHFPPRECARPNLKDICKVLGNFKSRKFHELQILRNSYQILQIAINSHSLAFSQIVLIEVVFDQKVFDITQKAPKTHNNDIFLPSLIYSLLRREHKKQQKMFFMNPADLKIRDKSGSRPHMH